MEPIVKYQFDREMVAFVKTLEIKSSMFGYDKNDVYSKFKDLLVRARDVCEELVAKERESLQLLMGEVEKAADDPAAIRLLLDGWTPESPVSEVSAEARSIEEAVEEAANEIQEEQAPAVDSEELIALRAQVAEYEKREEMLAQAHAIVSEARLERESIVRDAQMMAEQELFLNRAKRRDEETAFQETLMAMNAEREALEAVNAGYREYAIRAEKLFGEFRQYLSELDEFEGGMTMPKRELPKEIDPNQFDPPVLSSDMGTACTEESMPLCEMAEEIPEEIYHEQDDSNEQPVHDNVPPLSEPEDVCEGDA
ncbi:MAG: hypothetical protein M0O95_06030 [Clostridiales bacterium]|jgi:hypothetical protein|nr:hypothetical protein [Clostridiales bacterium]